MAFIKGNADVLDTFHEAAKKDRLSHAYIVEGEKGSGRLTLTRAILASLFCEKGGCGTCNSCKKVLAGVHQDIREISAAEGESTIKIEAIREAIQDSHIKPAESKWKAFVIRDAQLMTTAAQNAILQVFEEPPKNVLFFLLTTNRNLLLSTLKSRAVTIKTERFSDNEVREYLLERFPDAEELIEEATLVANGALGRGIDFISSEENRVATLLVKKYFDAVSNTATFANLSLILSPSAIGDKANIVPTLDRMNLALRDILVTKSGYDGRAMFFTDSHTLKELSLLLDERKLLKAREVVMRIIQDATRVNISSALSNLNMAMSSDMS